MKDFHPNKVQFYFRRDGIPMSNADALNTGLVLNGYNQSASSVSHADDIHDLHSFLEQLKRLIFQLHSYAS